MSEHEHKTTHHHHEHNETVVVMHDLPAGQHVHHLREVICKKGTKTLSLGPRMKTPQDASHVGHDQTHTYVRTDGVDGLGRPIFKLEGA